MNPTAEQKSQLEQYAIDGAPPYLIAYMSCSKGEFGEKVIQDINNLLIKMYQSDDYYQAHKKWFGEHEVKNLQRFLQEKDKNGTFLSPLK